MRLLPSLAPFATALTLSASSLAQPIPVIAVNTRDHIAPSELVERVAVAVGSDARRGAELSVDLRACLRFAPPDDALRAEREEALAANRAYFARGPRVRPRVEAAVRALEASPELIDGLPANREAYVRVMMALARIDIDERARTNDVWIRRVVTFDPTWQPGPNDYSPTLTELHARIRREAGSPQATLTVVTPREGCQVFVDNAVVEGAARERRLSVGAGVRDVTAQCGRRARVHVVRLQQGAEARLVIDPDLDADLTLDGAPSLTYAAASDAERVAGDASSLGLALAARRVVAVGAERVRVIDVDARSVIATIPSTASDLAVQVDAALSIHPSARSVGVTAPPVIAPSRGVETSRGPGVAPWVIVGVGGAALAAGAVFLVMRDAAFDDAVSRCAVDPASGTRTCGNLTDAERATASARYDDAGTWDALTWASVGVGAAAVAGGLIWYLAAPRGTSRSARAPSLTGSFASTGGTMRLGWSF